jgi:nucleoside-diphosphate-sugar epimerase
VKALVTGAAGFLGRHFTRALQARGYTVARCDTRLGLDAGQIFAGRLMVGAVHDLVVHCAAVEPHRAAIDGQPMHLAQNLALDAAMFDWAVRTGQEQVLYISSSAAYPIDLQDDWATARELREADIVSERRKNIGSPDAGYGWLKLTGERMALDAQRAGLPVNIVRPFSGYGEDQGENWPFGAFIARARRRDNPFVIWGDGTQVRDWIHVSDLVAGALEVIDQDVREPVNLCTGIGTSMAELVQLACKTAGYDPDIELRTDKPAGVAYRVGDPAKFHQIYTPKVSIAEGVERALA